MVCLFYCLPAKVRLPFLALTSLLFVAYFSFLSAISLVGSTAFTLLLAQRIEKEKSKSLLLVGLGFHLFLLFGLKYVFAASSSLSESAYFQNNATIVFLGLSFYTLQNLGYLLSVYWGRTKATKDYIAFFTFNAFFPKLSSGPIESHKSLLPQLTKLDQSPTSENFIYGIQRILLGLFKKVVLADRLIPFVENIYGLETQATGITVWAGVCLFALQLYFDFSGYIDIVLGSARLFGIRLSENFNHPFRATSISDLWRKWHITLINWLTQYLYYPVVYRLRRLKKWGIYTAIALVFLLSGFWHGLGVTFFIWAAWNIICLWYEVFTKSRRVKLSKQIPSWIYNPLSIFLTFNAFCFGLLFFRCASFKDSLVMLRRLFELPLIPESFTYHFMAVIAGAGTQEALFNIYSTLFLCFLFLLFERRIYRYFFSEQLRTIGVFVIVILILVFGIFDAGSNFIYLQF